MTPTWDLNDDGSFRKDFVTDDNVLPLVAVPVALNSAQVCFISASQQSRQGNCFS